ncbi:MULTISPECIES: hypothetical protein [unclassified Paenibacillus]|uniref:hypothetical protein n=1 Tax=unclassified Paenibacillus TaxID=185978 RepID=UPI0030FBCF7F
MECIVHFEVQHAEAVKPLRGLLFLEEGKTPGERELVEMFKDMKFNVRLDNREKWIFKPVAPGESYSEIRITSFDNGKKSSTTEGELKSIVGNLLPQKPTGI